MVLELWAQIAPREGVSRFAAFSRVGALLQFLLPTVTVLGIAFFWDVRVRAELFCPRQFANVPPRLAVPYER